LKIVVLLGGNSPERDVSLVTGRGIAGALRRRRHEVIEIDPALPMDTQDIGEDIHITDSPASLENKLPPKKILEWATSEAVLSSDLVFIALHGGSGEDGTVQAVLDMVGVPYTGSGVLASALSMNKDRAKALFKEAGVQTAPHILIRGSQIELNSTVERILSEFELPVVVKPNDQGSSVGFSFVDEPAGLEPALELALKYSDDVVIEKYIPGREITVAVLGDTALPVVEIVPQGGFYDYKRKYTKGTTEYIVPAPLEKDVEEKVKDAGLRAFHALSCRDYARVDFRLTDSGELYCLEVNTLPGMTELSLVPMAAREAGIEFDELVERIAMMAYSRSGKRRR